MQNSLGESLEQSPEGVPYTVVRRTWLSRKPKRNALFVTTLTLFILTIACFAQWNNSFGLGELWPASGESVYGQHQYWRLWTTLFVHGDLGHLLANSFMFFILGYFLSGYFGIGLFPGAAFLMGGVTNALAVYSYAPQVTLVGASGVVSWMGGAWLALYFLINTQISRTQRALRSFGVALMLFAPSEAFDPKISYRTHAIGFVLGVMFGLAYYAWHQRKFMRAEKVEVVVD